MRDDDIIAENQRRAEVDQVSEEWVEDQEALPFTPLHKTVLEGDQPCLLDKQLMRLLLAILRTKQKQLDPSLTASAIVNIINCY